MFTKTIFKKADMAKRRREFSAIIAILIVAAVGTYLLAGGHAASPYASISAPNGNLAGGAVDCPAAGATTGNATVFNQPLPMDGNVALGLSCSGTPFAPGSFWNTPLPASIPANPNNAAYLNDLAYDICYVTPVTSAPPATCSTTYHGGINTSSYSAPLYVVPANQPPVPVSRVCNGVPESNTVFSAAVAGGVPVPADAHSSGETNVPDSPTVTNQGTAGTTSYTYAVATVTASSTSEPTSTGGKTSTGNAALSATNYNVVSWNPVAGAVQYKVYRTSSSTSVSTGLIGTINATGGSAAQTFNDTGIVATTATPTYDTDKEITIYQPTADNGLGKVWEFWRFQKDASGNWDACWGGAIDKVSQSDGIFPSDSGATATSLPLLGAIPRIEELQAGQINHVMGLDLGNVDSGDLASNVIPANTPGATNGVSWPATRTDGGSTYNLAIPEGLRFRLPTCLHLPTDSQTCVSLATYGNNASTKLTPIAMTIAAAAQKYGFVVDDSGLNPGAGIRVGDPTTYITAGLPNPYTSGPGVGGVGNQGLFDGVTNQGLIMQNFPWNQLEALPFNYGEPASP